MLPCALCLFCGGCAWGVLLSFGRLLAKRVYSGVQVQQLASCIFLPPSSCRLLVVVSVGFTCDFGVGFGSGLCVVHVHTRTCEPWALALLSPGVLWLETLRGLAVSSFPLSTVFIIMADAQVGGRRRRAAQQRRESKFVQ